ncbi:MAG: hypothetical protein ACYS30_24775 [Planctomycetota bacterium]|jgi:hypothetical protein
MPKITLNISGEKWEEYKRCFLRIHPNTTAGGETPMPDDQWIKQKILQFTRRTYQLGKKKLHLTSSGPDYDNDIVTVN